MLYIAAITGCAIAVYIGIVVFKTIFNCTECDPEPDAESSDECSAGEDIDE